MLIFQVCFDVFYETEQPDMSQDRLYMRKQRFAATYAIFVRQYASDTPCIFEDEIWASCDVLFKSQ